MDERKQDSRMTEVDDFLWTLTAADVSEDVESSGQEFEVKAKHKATHLQYYAKVTAQSFDEMGLGTRFRDLDEARKMLELGLKGELKGELEVTIGFVDKDETEGSKAADNGKLGRTLKSSSTDFADSLMVRLDQNNKYSNKTFWYLLHVLSNDEKGILQTIVQSQQGQIKDLKNQVAKLQGLIEREGVEFWMKAHNKKFVSTDDKTVKADGPYAWGCELHRLFRCGGDQIAIRGHTGRYWTVNPADPQLLPLGGEVRSWEKFTIEWKGHKKVALMSNGKYLTAAADGTMTADSDVCQDEQIFETNLPKRLFD